MPYTSPPHNPWRAQGRETRPRLIRGWRLVTFQNTESIRSFFWQCRLITKMVSSYFHTPFFSFSYFKSIRPMHTTAVFCIAPPFNHLFWPLSWGPVRLNFDRQNMTLKQRQRAAEMATNDTNMDWNYNSDREKRKYNSEIPTATSLPPQYEKQQVLKVRLWTYVTPLRGPLSYDD